MVIESPGCTAAPSDESVANYLIFRGVFCIGNPTGALKLYFPILTATYSKTSSFYFIWEIRVVFSSSANFCPHPYVLTNLKIGTEGVNKNMYNYIILFKI